ncbi:MAG: hypothetical protein DI609_00815 [Corynebacterium urealyticum]|uniref:Uncharacterized protein n=1 Tax=Corynebacterium urealyticum TaxID=43771 RepID=A0A2W5D8A2_9CORY|nr:MAG: hypothetical protein DI609_00815 [Corynebacterium urealyticum]
MTSTILERVAKQPDGGTGTMPIVYPDGVHDVYLMLGPGVYDIILSWNGRAKVEAFHMWNKNPSERVSVVTLPSETGRKARRGIVRISSEQDQWVYFHSSGAFDANARLAVQVIPANLTLDFEVTTS